VQRRTPPPRLVDQVVRSIHKYASCSAECFILSLVYIDRLIQGNNLLLTSLNVHRIIITSVMLAAKFFDDQYFNNAYYAKVGGVPCSEMNSLELEFLFSINFSLHVPGEVYNRYRAELSAHMSAMVPGPELAALREVMIQAPSASEPTVLEPRTAGLTAQFGSSSSSAGVTAAASTVSVSGEDDDVDMEAHGFSSSSSSSVRLPMH
jgi:hypothetical protein